MSNRKIDKENVVNICPLTPMQEGMLFQYINNPDSSQYFEQLILTLQGSVDYDLFAIAWNNVVKINQMLRTVFRWEKIDKPVQIILRDYELPIRIYDYSDKSDKDKKLFLNEIKIKDFEEKINIAEAPFRLTLLKMAHNEYDLIVSHHHIILDGWSNGIIFSEFLDAYKKLCLGAEPAKIQKTDFKEYIEYLQLQDTNMQKAFWGDILKGFESKTILPADRKKLNSNFNSSHYTMRLDKKTHLEIESFAKDQRITLATILYAAWGFLLQKYGNCDDVLFGTTVAGRRTRISGIENMVGLFINTIPLRINNKPSQTVDEYLGMVNKLILDREAYESTSLTEIRACSPLNASESLFDSIVVIENYPLDKLINSGDDSISLKSYAVNEATNFDISLAIMPSEELVIKLIYNGDIFDEDTIKGLCSSFASIVTEFAKKPNRLLSEISILNSGELSCLLNSYNKTDTLFPKGKTLNELFEEQAAQNPDCTALKMGGKSVTYDELNKRANQIARMLISKGVKPKEAVGLIIDRSILMIELILGILKAGGAYLPLDSSLPKNKIFDILEDAKAKVIVSDKEILDETGIGILDSERAGGFNFVCIDEIYNEITEQSQSNLNKLNCSDDIAYIMYTSGSTGEPKGILTTHYNVSRVVKNTNYIDISASDILLQLSNYAFDGSTFDIYGALLNGATLVLVDKYTVPDVFELTELIKKEKVSVFFTTTALFNTIVDTNLKSLEGVRKILFGGERVSFRHVEKALDFLGKGRLIHVYGPTETTVYASYYDIDSINEDLGTIPIGKPISNTKLYVMDKYLNILPVGVPGELCIAGDGLAKGYLNKPESTAEKFVENPYVTDEIIYRTGDLVKCLHDGNIIFLDRIDSQVKLRGFRIELGEIEAQLLSLEGVNEATVVMRQEDSGFKYLCAYIISERGYSKKELKAMLKDRIPEYMIPSAVVRLDKLPLNSNGKIDKKSLPEPEVQIEDTVFEKPSNQEEEIIQRIWQEVLAIEPISVTANFFELGGHSLKATLVASKIHKAMDVKVPIKEIFNNPTIKELSSYIRETGKQRYEPILPVGQCGMYPVSCAQKRLFVQAQYEDIGISYNIPVGLMIKGKIDFSRLEEAFNMLIKRHEPLRTSFSMLGGEIVQIIDEDVSFKLECIKSDEDRIKLIAEDFIKPFDLCKAPLIRACLIEIKEDKYTLIIDVHHIISDGISVSVMIKELFALYENKKADDLTIQYKDFAVWHNKLLESEEGGKQERYWMDSLSGELPLLDMPMDYIRGAKRSFNGRSLKFLIPASLTRSLNRLASEYRVTLNTVLLSAYYILLLKYSSQEDIVIGSLVAGRNHADTESMLGMFNNFLPLRIKCSKNSSARSLIKKVNTAVINGFENEYYPYDKMVEKILRGKVDRSRNPLFDTMLILHNQMDSINASLCKELDISSFILEHNTSKLDFKLDVFQKGDGDCLECVLEYNIDLFKDSSIARMAEHFTNIIKSVAASPDISIEAVEMLSPQERHVILGKFNDTDSYYQKDQTIHWLFERQVGRTPDKPAVILDDEMLTYRQLNIKANKLASLLRAKGVTNNTIVGIMTERSLEMAVGIMAIIKAGGAYMPISKDYPLERIRYMLQDSGASILLTHKKCIGSVADIANEIIVLEDEGIYRGSEENPMHINTSKDLAYVIYTSGSTGNPKGVMIEHYSLINRLNWMQKAYPLGESDVILQKTPYTFDVSLWELFWWTMTGASVCYLEPDGEKDPEKIVRAIERHGVTTIHFVPSMFNVFMEHIESMHESGRLTSLKRVFASGEALGLNQVNRFNRLLNEVNGTTLHNLYGPTEATVDVSFFDCSNGDVLDKVPIGRPIDNIKLYVVDESARLCPIGVPGELCISGDGLARGYLNKPELTEEKFVANPFAEGLLKASFKRMYRTGDLVRWMEDGNIEYLGRMDNQVKIRGFRIELGEIEAILARHKDVSEALVLAKADKSGDKYLCAYYVGDEAIDVQNLRAYLKLTLPEYMIPSYFIRLDSMPLSANGKIDRNRLPEPIGEISSAREYVEPETETEKQMAAIWSELLEIEKVGKYDDFFEFGGHSLKAVSLATKIHKVFQIELSLAQIFESSSLHEMAACLAVADRSDFCGIAKVEEREYYPVSSAQNRLFILDQIEEQSTAYNLPGVIMVSGKLDKERLREVFRELVQRHETLRTSFAMVGGNPVQIVNTIPDFKTEFIDGSEKMMDEVIRDFIKPFDLSKAPLLRVQVVRIDDERHLLMFDMHHIISDGVSMVILVKEFVEAYNGNKLGDISIQYRDYAVWQNGLADSMENQKEYWLNQFKGELPVLDLPLDYPRPSIQKYEGEKLSFELDKDIVKQLRKKALETDTTLYMQLLAAYYILLYKYSGQEDIIIGSPTAGRRHADIEGLIGMFVNTLALRSFPEGDKVFSVFLEEVKHNCLNAFENQDYQFEKLVESLELKRDLSRNPMFDTMFVLQNMGIPELNAGKISFAPYAFESRVSKFDMTFEVIENKASASLNVEYCTRLFKQDTIKRMASHFINILKAITKNPNIRLKDIDMLTNEEHVMILGDFNNTLSEYRKDCAIHWLFEEQVRKTPHKTAVVFENKYVTYEELNNKANQLANNLREKGVHRDKIVGMLVERSIEMAVGIMAIEKAGGAYMPISPDYPDNRIKYMLEDSGAEIVLTQGKFKDKLIDLSVSILDLEDESNYCAEKQNPQHVNLPSDIAYVIYTSGSTGNPKGVMIEHYSLINRLNWMNKKYPLSEDDVILQKTPYTFDVSLWEIFWWSIVGSSVCYLVPGGERDPGAMIEAIEKNRVTTMHFVPSMLNAFLDYIEDKPEAVGLASLKRVFASGEALSLHQVERFNRLLFDKYGTTLHNLYGPTEATVDVSYFDCSTGETLHKIPIGKPIDNIRLYVIDESLNLCPIGVAGELCITGDGLARGYLNRTELTDEKFVSNPFYNNALPLSYKRMYKTGDLARWLPDGNIEYLGRIDNQVKVSGFRIELGEIEARLLMHSDIKETVVTARTDGKGNKFLCGYYVGNRELNVQELREHLGSVLPEYMIPAYFVKLDEIPLSSNGKVDRKRLPEPSTDINTGREYVEPTSLIEKQVAEVWKDVLGIDKVGIHDSFFELGGYSILLIQMHSKINELFPGKVKVTDFFAVPTIAQLAEFIRRGDEENKKLEIACIALPAEYVTDAGSEGEVVLKAALTPQLSKKVIDASKEGIKLHDILFSVYIYLFSQITDEKNITLQSVSHGMDKVKSIEVNLNNINQFNDLVREAAEKQANEEKAYSLNEAVKATMSKEKQEVIPLFGYKADLASFSLLDVYDLVLAYELDECEVACTLTYNGTRLNKGKMKYLLSLYIKLVELLVN